MRRIGAAGFTLIEVLVVVAIAGLLVAIAAVNLLPGDEEIARREAGQLALAVEGVRDEAWFGGRPIAVSVEGPKLRHWKLRADRAWEPDAARDRPLGEGLRVTALFIAGEPLPPASRLVFLPDGFGVPFRMVVEVRGIQRAIEGDAAGAVRVVEKAR